MIFARKKTISPWRSFAASLLTVIILFVSALYTGIYLNNNRTIEAELETRARSLFESIVLTRTWSSQYGGVFVEKTAGVVSNPFLDAPDIIDTQGRVYTKKNPALMTREMSELAEDATGFRFRITSLDPTNPVNAADDFERKSLQDFINGEKEEAFAKETRDNSVYFRYIAPIHTERSCLECHPNYHIGDVRGGISITFNIDGAQEALRVNRLLIICSFLITLVSFIAIVARLVLSLKRKLEIAEAKLRELATTDELTGLKNRRFIMDRMHEVFHLAIRYHRPIACVLFDLDFFKRINDTFGHDAGDATLKKVSAAAANFCRQTDVLARYGGEEFLLLMPETSRDGAVFVTERIRKAIEDLVIAIPGGREVRVTSSFGIACREPTAGVESKLGVEGLISKADQALYRAKNLGRNRVEVA